MSSNANYPYLYILAKSIFENDGSIIDCCQPFILKCLTRSFAKTPTLQNKISTKYNLNIPINTLNSILSTLVKSDLCEKSQKQGYSITGEGIAYLNQLEKKDDVERKLNELYQDILKYYEQKSNIEITTDEISSILVNFSTKNIKSLFCIFYGECEINKDITSEIPVTEKLSKKEQILVKYIEHTSTNHQNFYHTLKDIVLGAIFIIIGCTDTKINHGTHYAGITAYLDSNFLFSVLGLRDESFTKPAIELLQLLKKYEFKLRVLNFTVNEITRVLSAYSHERKKYPKGVRVNSIHSHLKSKGWSTHSVKEYISEIEEKLLDLGIEIENTDIEIEKLDTDNCSIASTLKKFKKRQRHLARNHDIAAIEHIKHVRGKEIRKLNESIAIFVTSDGNLCNANYLDMGHKQYGTISETILDRLLTTILWLIDPSFNISLESLIAVCGKDLFVKQSVWEHFYNVLVDIAEKDVIPLKDISTLFFHNHIEGELLELDDNEIDDIDEEFIYQKIEESKITLEKDQEHEVLVKTTDIAGCLESTQEEIKKYKQVIHNEVERTSIIRANIMSFLITSTLLYSLVSLYLYLNNVGLPNLFSATIPILFGGASILGVHKYFRETIKNKIYNSIISKKIELFKSNGIDLNSSE